MEPHLGSVALQHTFAHVYAWLGQRGPVRLVTPKKRTPFTAEASVAQQGAHAGEGVIRFFSGDQERARAYECCWGHDLNCNRTMMGMYCSALDAAVP